MDSEIKEKSSRKTYDLTQGSIIPVLLQFAWPLLVGNIFQQLYNTADSIIVGNYVGAQALAAIGVYTPIYNLLLGLFQGIATGATVVVSQSYGAKNSVRLNKSIYISIVLTVIVGLVIAGIGLLINKPLLHLINTPEDIFQMAATYARIMFLGVLAVLMYNILCGILRGMGDSVKPLLFLVISCVLNVFLDYLFVVTFKWGIEGAAYATLIAQAMSAIVAFIYLLKSQDKYGVDLHGQKPDWGEAKQLLAIGIPTGMQSVLFNVGFLMQQNLVNSFGSTVVAAYAVFARVDSFVQMPMSSFSTALTAFVGQNVGAHKLKRAMEGIRKVFWLSQIMDIVLSGILLLTGAYVLRLFTGDTEVIRTGVEILRIFCIGYIVLTPYIIYSGAVRGVGDTLAPLLASFSCNVILRVAMAYLFVHFTHDYHSIFVAVACAWLLCSTFMLVYYHKGVWRRKIHGFYDME